MRKFLIGIVRVLDSTWFTVTVIVLALGTLLWAGGAFAGIFQNPTERLDDSQAAYSEWEVFSARQTRFLKRSLFSAHCEAIDKKEERGEQVLDARYIAPCNKNDIELYFKIRSGFTTVQ